MNSRIYYIWVLLLLFTAPAWAQQEGDFTEGSTTDTTTSETASTITQEPQERAPWRDKVFFGGGGGLQFSNIATQIALMPSVGYRVTDKWQVGTTIIYQYTRWRTLDINSHSYGFSPFTRYFVLPQIYAAAEYEQINYDIVYNDRTRDRRWVDRMLIGAGYFQGSGGRGGFHIGVFYDVFYNGRANDENYPYESPFVYRVGFIF